MKEILIPLNFTTTPTVTDTKQSFSASDEASGVLTFTTTADVAGTVASLTIRNASENANRQTVLIERLDVNSSPFSYALKNPLPFGQYEGTVLLKKNLTTIASATFLFGVNSSLSAEVLPDLVKAYSLDELVENVETEVSNLKDAFNLTVSETVKGVNKTESTLQAQENVRYLNEHTRKTNEESRIANEQARIAAELVRKDTFDTLVDSAVIEETVAQEVANEFQQIESTYANRLLSTEQQLEQNDIRLDNIIAEAGDGTIPSELVDVKVAFDSELFPTAGTAVRTQVEELHAMEVGANVVPFQRSFAWEIGGIASASGNNTTATDRIRTPGFITGVNKFKVAPGVGRINGRWSLHKYTQAGVWINQVLSGSYLTEYPLDPAYKYRLLYAFSDPIVDFNIQAADITFYKTYAPLALQDGSVTLAKLDVDLAASLGLTVKTDGKFMHLSSDDIITMFKNIYTNAYTSIFEQPTLAFLKSMHDTYGICFSGYCFWQTDDLTFNLSMMPSTYAAEFEANSDWLKFGAHYLDNNGGNFGTIDTATGVTYYTNIMTELFRICGTAKSFDFVPRLQNFAGSLAFIQAVKPLAFGFIGLITAEDIRTNYHLTTTQRDYLTKHDRLYDAVNDLTLFATDLRLENVTDMTVTLNERKASLAYSGTMRDILLFTHEYYLGQAATQAKFTAACQWAVANGYAFDFPQNRM